MTSAPELALILPVYNEETLIEEAIDQWTSELSRLKIDFVMHVYDDGSGDRTPEILASLRAAHPRLTVHTRANAGHGPTVLAGYRQAGEAQWIFQADSDNEIPPRAFGSLWVHRSRYDLLIGERTGRAQPMARAIMSRASSTLVRLLYGRGISDVNIPFRLMRAGSFSPLVARMPDATFAPNVLISGWAVLKGLRIFVTQVPYRERTAGQASLRSLRTMARAAGVSLCQTVLFRFSPLCFQPQAKPKT